MPNYTHDSERWLRSNAALYQRRGNQQMARNFELCAEDVKALRAENDTLRKESEFYRAQCDMRDKLRDKVEAEIAALKDAAKGLIAIHRRHKDLIVYSDQDYIDIWSERVGALAALVGEE